LRIYDTAGNPAQAAIQAQKAVDDGAKIILGPLFGEAANAAGMAVADEGINVLSFSNNTSIAGGNVFILGKTFQNTSNRLLTYAASKGKSRAVILYPDNIEGKFGRAALEKSAQKLKIEVVNSQPFEFTQKGIVNAVPLARASIEVEDADLLLLTSNSAGALPLLGQLLPESGINTEKVQFAGISRWDIPQQTLRLTGLQGGWFTTPDQVVRKNFSKRYEALYQKRPHQLAGLAFDGIAAIGALVQTGKPHALASKGLTQSAGFEGVDGIFRFLKDRTNERGLAIAEVRNKQVYIIDPAPRFFRF
jgi:ABC-type branched-subunit amino acid transport system substrate-binding protein